MTTSATVEDQIGRDGSCSMSTTISQSSALQQGLVQGASLSRSSDITTSNSVINSSSSAATAQSGDQQWLDSSVSGWDKQPGSQPNTPRLEHMAVNNPAATSQFSWNSQPFPSSSSSFSSDAQVTNKWGNTNNSSNMQSAWGSQSQSPSLSKQQMSSNTSSEWSMPTGNASTTQWGMPPPPSGNEDEPQQNSWGQPRRLPNAGTDDWGQAASSGQANTPSSANAQLSQWGQSTPQPSSTSAWSTPVNPANTSNSPSNQPPAPSTSSGSITSSSTVVQTQWGATTSAGQPNIVSPSTSSSASISGFTSPQQESTTTTTPTSWAGAAAKGLPKAVPKPPEPIDPVKLALEQTINDPEGWGRLPVRQDTSWGKPPEKNKQDESNQWHSTQNNGTAIWESSKNSSGATPPADKSTWNQKVAGNNDPNVWNGEGSKGKDNALWDDVPGSKDSEPTDQPNTWNSQGAQSRTMSQSSGGENSAEPGWSSTTAAGNGNIIHRSSPPNSITQSSASIGATESNWTTQNGNIDPRRLNRWDSAPAQIPSKIMNSMSDADGTVGTISPVVDILQHNRLLQPQGLSQPQATGSAIVAASQPLHSQQSNITAAAAPLQQLPTNARGGASSYWEQGQVRPNGPPSNWNSKLSNSWTNDNSSAGAVGWGQSQPNIASSGTHGGSWGDGPSNNQWQSGPGPNRKPSFSWEDNQANGGVIDYGRDRGRPMKSDPDLGDDADMGDWNESNSVWSSAGGFKQPRKHTTIPENHMPPPHMQPSSRMGGPGGPYGGASNNAPGMMHGGNGNMGGNGHMGSSKQQMISILMSYKFSKEDAHSALINNNMNMEAAIAELRSNMMQQQMTGRPNDFGRGPVGDNTYNPSIPPPNMPTNALNTPYTNNAQLNQSAVQASSRMNKPNQQRGSGGAPMARAQNHQQQAIVKQLEMGVAMNNIHPLILHLPLHENNVRLIQQLLTLQQTYQAQQESLAQLQRRQGPSGPHVDHYTRTLASLNNQMKSIQAPLIKEAQSQMSVGKFTAPADSLAGLSLANNPSSASSSSSQTSRLGIWTDKAPGSARQGAPPANHSSLHASHSTPNLHGGVLGDNSNPWSTPAGSVSGMWSSVSPSGQYVDNPNESHSSNLSNGPHIQSIAAHPSQSFDIPEFVPGVPWQGTSCNKVEDDPNITPGSVARSLSVSTATLHSGRTSTDLGWGSSKSTWSTAQNLGSPAGGELWAKGGSTRPPPGFGKNMNRSMSMPQGPSEKASAFSPVTGGWDSQQTMISSSPWLLLRNLSSQIDGNTLKTLCSQHGPLQSFFVNTNSGQALIRYTTKEEGLKAQKSLNSCSLYDTTILAEFVEDSEVQRIIDQCQRQGSNNIGRSHSISAAPGSGMWPNNNYGSSSNLWGAGGSMPMGGSSSASVVSPWSAGGLSGPFLPTVDSNFAM